MKSLMNLFFKIFDNKYFSISCCRIRCCGMMCCSINCEKIESKEFESIDEEWRRIILELSDDGDFEMTSYTETI